MGTSSTRFRTSPGRVRASRHNLKYWSDGDWVGFGCGAHSTVEGVRWKNLSSTEDFIAAIDRQGGAATDRRQLSDQERLGDALFTGLRLAAGVDEGTIRSRYGVDVWERFGTELARLVDAGLLVREGGRLRLTRAGMLLANEVMSVFV